MSSPLISTRLSPASAAAVKRVRRPWVERVAHAPQALRALVRGDEIWLVVLAALVGLAAGVVVVAMNETAQLMHAPSSD